VRTAAALAVAGLWVSASSCGHASASPQRIVTRAPAATTAAHTAHLTVAVSGGSAGPVTLSGAIDFAATEVDVSSVRAGAPKSETIVIGDAIYSMLPGVGSANGKPWLKVSRSALAGGGAGLAGLSQTSVDPTGLLAALQTSSLVATVGADTVRGVSVMHYAATMASAPSQVDVWIDAQGRIRRLAVASGTGSSTTTTEFYDFGTAVHIVAPPPDQVADLQTLLNP
jgi:hypothetical protein